MPSYEYVIIWHSTSEHEPPLHVALLCGFGDGSRGVICFEQEGDWRQLDVTWWAHIPNSPDVVNSLN